MILRRFYDDYLAQASFLVGCSATGEAAIVDPNRDVEQYIRAAEAEGLRITAVTETHIHADFLSGARELAHRTGARLYLSDEGDANWKYAYADGEYAALLKDGDEIVIGNVKLRAMHTPGHTPEHLSFGVIDTPASSEIFGVMTGDFVFAGDVGRPDLLETAAGVKGVMQSSAETLFTSLRKFRDLSSSMVLWPGHGAGSACGKALGGVPETTLGYELKANWGFLAQDRDSFVHEALLDQPEPPLYFADMKRLNKLGPPTSTGLGRPPQLAASLLSQALLGQAVVVDVRPYDVSGTEHVQGTVALPLDRSFAKWAGSLISLDEDVYVIATGEQEAHTAAMTLAKIGIDRVKGWFDGSASVRLMRSKGEVAPVERVTGAEFIRDLEAGRVTGLDVRSLSERHEEHEPMTQHLPLARLRARLNEIDRSKPVYVHCAGGGRSGIASTYLRRLGYEAFDLKEGFDALPRRERVGPEAH